MGSVLERCGWIQDVKNHCKSGMGHAAQGAGAGYRCSPVFSISSLKEYPGSFHAFFFFPQQLYSVVFIMLIWAWKDGASIILALCATANFTVEWIIPLPMHFDLLVLCTVNKWDLRCICCCQSAFGCCQKLPGVNYLNWTPFFFFSMATFLKAKELWSLYNNLVLGKVSFFFKAVCRGTEF